ncbi:MAG: DUF763 domain-containing protein [Candidatus Hadarchaeales archaeon]
MKSGIAELPLHGGRCPPWLFKRMKCLSEAICRAIVLEYGQEEFLRRIGDPFFFQALGCTLGFDWHSSGLTTTVCGALKEAIRPEELGISVCGGKGRTSRLTPEEIERAGDVFSLSSHTIDRLKHASRMAAKVDSACVQDGYQLYHHVFIFTENGDWAVIQQGMHGQMARRYHWLFEGVKSFVEEPHSGIIGDRSEEVVLDMTARDSEETRKTCVDLVRDNPKRLLPYVREAEQRSLDEYFDQRSPKVPKLVMPTSHAITKLTEQTLAALQRAYELQPENYEGLVAIRGIGPKAVRALALVSDLIYGKPPSWKDPVKFSFAHGGKDGVPYPVDKITYQRTIEILGDAVKSAGIGQREKLDALRRLHVFMG